MENPQKKQIIFVVNHRHNLLSLLIMNVIWNRRPCQRDPGEALLGTLLLYGSAWGRKAHPKFKTCYRSSFHNSQSRQYRQMYQSVQILNASNEGVNMFISQFHHHHELRRINQQTPHKPHMCSPLQVKSNDGVSSISPCVARRQISVIVWPSFCLCSCSGASQANWWCGCFLANVLSVGQLSPVVLG